MNTKDLWQALTCNPITDYYFDGIFPADALTEIKDKPELIICNTDPSTKPGKHWLLFFFYDDKVDFYDSLGKDLSQYGKEFNNLVNRFANFYQSTYIRTQPENTALCGYYCLYFAYKRCKGIKMDNIIKEMKSSKHVVNFVKQKFTFCNFENFRFQCCIKL